MSDAFDSPVDPIFDDDNEELIPIVPEKLNVDGTVKRRKRRVVQSTQNIVDDISDVENRVTIPIDLSDDEAAALVRITGMSDEAVARILGQKR